jgi:hypothetical protein
MGIAFPWEPFTPKTLAPDVANKGIFSLAAHFSQGALIHERIKVDIQSLL